MTSKDVRECLLKRWPPSEYVSINEAPQTSDGGGRKLDVVVVSLWRSRGYELDGVEIKVSVSDWKRELNEAAKADWWWNHVHRFWVAVPAKIADKVREDLPSGWGLLSCTPESSTVVVKPDKHTAEPLSWGTSVGLIRAAANAGVNALAHAEQKGYRLGKESVEVSNDRSNGDAALRRKMDDLSAKVHAFESASGLNLSDCWSESDAKRLGQLVSIIEKRGRDPHALMTMLERQADQVERQAKSLRDTAKDLSNV